MSSDAHQLTGTGAAAVRAREKGKEIHNQAIVSPQTRDARIAELRRQYLEGTYCVEASQLSAAIVKRHLAKDS